MRFIAWRGLSDAYRAATEGHSPWTPDAVDPEPVLVPDAPAAGFEPELEAAVLREGIGALAFIPLVHDGRLLGKFMLYRDAPHDVARPARCGSAGRSRTTWRRRPCARGRGRALRDSREQLETIMRTVDEGIVVQSAAGQIVYANDSAARVVGFENAAEFLAADRDEVLGRFEMLDEDGAPLAPDELPGRRALARRDARARDPLPEQGDGRGALVGRPRERRSRRRTRRRRSLRERHPRRHGVESSRRASASSFLARAGELLNATLDDRATHSARSPTSPSRRSPATSPSTSSTTACCAASARGTSIPRRRELMIELRARVSADRPGASRPARDRAPASRSSCRTCRRRPRRWRTTSATRARSASSATPPASSSRSIARGRTFGAITFGTVPPQPRFDEADVELAIELGRRASAALDNALLYARGAGAGARRRGARVRRRRRLPRRPRRDRPALESRGGAHLRGQAGEGDRPAASTTSIPEWETVRDRIAGAPSRRAGTRRADVPVDGEGRASAGSRSRPSGSPAAPCTRSAT